MDSAICVPDDTDKKNRQKTRTSKLYLLFLLLFASWLNQSRSAQAEVSHPELALEATYTEALLHYNKNEIAQAARLLDKALQLDPRYLPALEMRALTLKIKGNDDRAIEIYTQLITQKAEKDQGPYHFELATLYQKKKNVALAKNHLNACIKMHFNEVPSHLLLGNIEFTGGNYASADEHMSFVKDHGPPELQLIARYYLGLLNFRMSYGTLATAEILEARALAEKLPHIPSSAEIIQSTEQILTPFKKPRWFINASSLGQYDSNIGQLPIGISNPVSLSGKSTGKMNLSAGVGWMDAPLSPIQMVYNYQGSFNQNTNPKTQNYQYFTNSASIYANYKPLSTFSGGMKAVGNFTFQNELLSSTSTNYTYGKSSASVEFGPFLKAFLNKTLQLQIDFYFRPQVYWIYPSQTGNAFGTRVQLISNTVKQLFNPSWNFTIEKTNATGADVRYLASSVGFSNLMRLTGSDTLNASIGLLYTNYFDSTLKRVDLNLPLRINWSHYLSSQWMLLCDISYVNNFSNVSASYSYNQFTGGLGIAWSPL